MYAFIADLEAHCMYQHYVEANVEDKVLYVAQNGDKGT